MGDNKPGGEFQKTKKTKRKTKEKKWNDKRMEKWRAERHKRKSAVK